MEKTSTHFRINVGKIHYRDLNNKIRQKIFDGYKHFILENVIGQRYIGAGLDEGITIEIYGVPGQDLGVFNGGSKIIVYGNAQDGVGNTMNGGEIIIFGSCGDIPGHMARNGKIYIRGSAGFRAGIMMKEYGDCHPVMIVGEKIGEYAGEYMAGGIIIVLGYGLGRGESPVSRHLASGIFGGEIFVRGEISSSQIGNGAFVEKAKWIDVERIRLYIEEYCRIFSLNIDEILSSSFYHIRRIGERPFGGLYVPSNKVSSGVRPVHINLLPPCASACPVGIPNPMIIQRLKTGRVEEAFELIDEYTPFRYSCCGMVCPGLCKAACTRSSLDEPVKIDEIAKKYHPTGKVRILEGKKSRRIAIIGGGPAGLSAAWQLSRRGYDVDVYEKEENIGGKLASNIPEERLPRAELDKDLKRIESLPIGFIKGVCVDGAKFREIREKYDAVIIAIGAQRPKRLGFEGEEFTIPSYYFLRAVKNGKVEYDLEGKSVVIVGAGNVAMDVACEVFRLGASGVTAIDIQRPSAFGKELERAMKYGLEIIYPKFVEKYSDGWLYFRDGDSIRADFVIEAIGETPEIDFAGQSIIYGKDSFTTNLPMVFVAGDVVNPGLVTHSIAMGREVALYIHSVFSGLPYMKERVQQVDKTRINVIYFKDDNGFANELDRCISCGTCIQCDICVDNCPRGAIERRGERFIIDYELCTGCGVCAGVCPRGAIIMEPESKND